MFVNLFPLVKGNNWTNKLFYIQALIHNSVEMAGFRQIGCWSWNSGTQYPGGTISKEQKCLKWISWENPNRLSVDYCTLYAVSVSVPHCLSLVHLFLNTWNKKWQFFLNVCSKDLSKFMHLICVQLKISPNVSLLFLCLIMWGEEKHIRSHSITFWVKVCLAW